MVVNAGIGIKVTLATKYINQICPSSRRAALLKLNVFRAKHSANDESRS
jgi:hypothetical protein